MLREIKGASVWHSQGKEISLLLAIAGTVTINQELSFTCQCYWR